MSTDITDRSHTTGPPGWVLLFAAWLLACIGTLGSLFFSEVMGLPPCVLCWWQRVFMYPLVVILLIGLLHYDRSVVRYALPLVVLGWLTAFYHYLLYSGYIPEALQPCGQGPSCAEINLELFGFVTIPLLSLAAFSVLAVLLLAVRQRIGK
jgi:disulfide bond formation protein DsbB